MNLPIGVIVRMEDVLQNGISAIEDLGFCYCQLNCWDPELFTRENAIKLKEIMGDKIVVTSLWVGWPGPAVWDFIDGPKTLGLVPKEYRYIRMECLKKGADFAAMLGICDIITHVGFIPENPTTTLYHETVSAVRSVMAHCKKNNVFFNFETGQETPITLIRIIEDIGMDNVGINLDPANLLLYGKANPIDAVDIYKKYVRSVHVKDGLYPTNGRELGIETAVGEGLVNFPVLIPRLLKHGFSGPLIIEREISGEQQNIDIIKAKDLLELILRDLK